MMRPRLCAIVVGLLAGAWTACESTQEPCASGSAESLQVEPDLPTMERGQTVDLRAVVRDACGTELGREIPVEWSVEPAGRARIYSTGRLVADSAGIVIVSATASDGDVELSDEATIEIRRTPHVQAAGTMSIFEGQATQLDYSVTDYGGLPIDGLDVVWTSSDPDVVTADEGGQVLALAAGNATLHGTIPGVEHVPAEMAVTVVENDIAAILIRSNRTFSFVPPGLVWNGSNADTTIVVPSGLGTTTSLLAIMASGDTVPYEGSVSWSSSAPGIVSVDAAGNLTAEAPGAATITAQPGNAPSASHRVLATTGYDAVELGFEVAGINDLGEAVGRSSTSAMLWSGGVATSIGDWHPWDLNSDGVIVGSKAYFATDGPAVAWREGVLDTLPDGGCGSAVATALNETGVIVGSVLCGTGAVRWDGDAMDTLGIGTPAHINAAGVIVGGGQVWTEWSVTDLQPPAGWEGAGAGGINDTGWIVGSASRQQGTSGMTGVGIVWNPSGNPTIHEGTPERGYPPYAGPILRLDAINNAGVIVGLRGWSSPRQHVVMHPGQPPIPLGLISTLGPGGNTNQPRVAMDINQTGQIVAGTKLLTPLPF